MALLVDAFPVAYHQYLGRFMVYLKGLGYFVGYRAKAKQVQVIKVNCGGGFGSFQPALHHPAGIATGAVFEDHLGAIRRSFKDVVQLCFCVEVDPVH